MGKHKRKCRKLDVATFKERLKRWCELDYFLALIDDDSIDVEISELILGLSDGFKEIKLFNIPDGSVEELREYLNLESKSKSDKASLVIVTGFDLIECMDSKIYSLRSALDYHMKNDVDPYIFIVMNQHSHQRYFLRYENPFYLFCSCRKFGDYQ